MNAYWQERKGGSGHIGKATVFRCLCVFVAKLQAKRAKRKTKPAKPPVCGAKQFCIALGDDDHLLKHFESFFMNPSLDTSHNFMIYLKSNRCISTNPTGKTMLQTCGTRRSLSLHSMKDPKTTTMTLTYYILYRIRFLC